MQSVVMTSSEYEQFERNWLPVHRSEVAVARAVFEWKRPALLNALVPFH